MAHFRNTFADYPICLTVHHISHVHLCPRTVLQHLPLAIVLVFLLVVFPVVLSFVFFVRGVSLPISRSSVAALHLGGKFFSPTLSFFLSRSFSPQEICSSCQLYASESESGLYIQDEDGTANAMVYRNLRERTKQNTNCNVQELLFLHHKTHLVGRSLLSKLCATILHNLSVLV